MKKTEIPQLIWIIIGMVSLMQTIYFFDIGRYLDSSTHAILIYFSLTSLGYMQRQKETLEGLKAFVDETILEIEGLLPGIKEMGKL